MRFSLVSAACLAASALAIPVSLEERQSSTTCGSTSYTAAQVRAAVSQGYNYYASDQQVGSNDYPHTYNNYEGFGQCSHSHIECWPRWYLAVSQLTSILDFDVSGPYQEFPLLKSGPYTGGMSCCQKLTETILTFCRLAWC